MKFGSNAAPGKSTTIRSGLLIFVTFGLVAPDTAIISRFSVNTAPFTRRPVGIPAVLPGAVVVCGTGVGLGEVTTLPAVVPLSFPGVALGVGAGVLVAVGLVVFPQVSLQDC